MTTTAISAQTGVAATAGGPKSHPSRLVAGVDIGGTFTDIVLLERATGTYTVHKVLGTPDDPSRAVLRGLGEAIERAGARPTDVDYVVHGTTIVANTLIERKGADVAVLTTAGFGDLLEMAREQRYDAYDLFARYPAPLVDRADVIEVDERVRRDGSILKPLDGVALIDRLRNRPAPDAVAVCLLHAYAHPGHERAVRDLLADVWPDARVSLSHEVASYIGEYERLVTTVANAYVQPIVDAYLGRLEAGLLTAGIVGPLYLMLSDGGVTTTSAARSLPVRLLESGPAAGIAATCALEMSDPTDRLVAFDMGGTTAKFCIIDDGRPLTTWTIEVDRMHRFKQGSGIPLRIPSVDMVEIGAGGGSIARIDPLGLPTIGPQSAGSDPGPACYGRGGTEPTVTDSLAVLGVLNPDFFLGGRMSLDIAKAATAIDTSVGSGLGTDDTQGAALGIHEIACSQMAEAMRTHFAERGKDPRTYAMVAFGGAGPLHARTMAETVGISTVIVPPAAGVMSAAGLLRAPFSFAAVRGVSRALDDIDWGEIGEIVDELAAEATREVAASGADVDGELSIQVLFDMKYAGQNAALEVAIPPAGDYSTQDVRERFEAAHREVYGRHNRALVSIVESVKVKAIAASLSAGSHTRRGFASARPTPRREVLLPGMERPLPADVLDRASLAPGARGSGPALIEDGETTVVVGFGDTFEIDTVGNVIVRIRSAESSVT